MAKKKNAAKKASKKAKKRRGATINRPYPRVPLEEALQVPQALKDKNGGNPWPPEQVAEALDMSKPGFPIWLL